MTTSSCLASYRHGVRPAFVRVTPQSRSIVADLCVQCLNHWLDNADDDPDLEPHRVVFLDTGRVLEAPNDVDVLLRAHGVVIQGVGT